MNNDTNDIILWESFKTGNKESFGLLFRRYYGQLYNYGCKITSDTNLLEDTIQELFTELWQNKSQTQVLSVKAYLMKALKYKLFKQLKCKKSFTQEVPEAIHFEISYESLKIASEEDEIKAKKIHHSLQRISNRQKEIIYLKFYQDLSYDEISEVMQINYQVARNLLYQAVKSLKVILQDTMSMMLFFV